MSETYHVEPENDLREHDLNPEGLCPCLPTRDPDEPRVWVHNAYDGRELREVLERALDMMGVALAGHEHRWSPRMRWVYEQAHNLLKMHMPNHVAYTMGDEDKAACWS